MFARVWRLCRVASGLCVTEVISEMWRSRSLKKNWDAKRILHILESGEAGVCDGCGWYFACFRSFDFVGKSLVAWRSNLSVS